MTPNTSYPIGFCRNGHLWATSFYMKKNGKFFCKVCNYNRTRERASLAIRFPDRVQPVEVRVLKRIDKTPGHGPNGDCWIYTGESRYKNDKNRYSIIRGNGKNHRVHRLMWELENGPIPEGLLLLHKCDFPPCCRPDHLTPGTQQDNMRDMIAKGRGADMKEVSKYRASNSGERNGRVRHSWEIVRAIRAEYATGDFSMTDLAAKYETHASSICQMINRKIWKDDPLEKAA